MEANNEHTAPKVLAPTATVQRLQVPAAADAADAASRDVEINGDDPPTLLHEAPAEDAAPETKLVSKRNEDGLLAAGDGGMCGSSDIDVLGSNVLAAISENYPRSLIQSTKKPDLPS